MDNGCWEWQGCVNTDGYPKIGRNYNSNIKGHRYVYEQVKGEIGPGLVVRHTCDNILCLNPDHLILGTPSDNMRDRRDRARTSKHVTDEQNSEIRVLLAKGMSQNKIAEIVGCSQVHVSKVKRGFYKYLNC